MIPVIAPWAWAGMVRPIISMQIRCRGGGRALGATRLLMLSDVAGVKDRDGNLIPRLTLSEARALIADGTVSDGMIPKLETCIQAVADGAEAAVIMDGRAPHAILVELFTEDGIGTLVCND